MLTLLDLRLTTTQEIESIVGPGTDVLYYGENVKDVLFSEHSSVLRIKVILS